MEEYKHGEPSSSPEPEPPRLSLFTPGQLLAKRFQISRLIARGGMGEVYEALDRELGEQVALKCIRPEFVNQQAAPERFKREILVARRIAHPTVCRVYDFGMHRSDERDGPPILFFTMEYLEGEPLSASLKRRGVLSSDEARWVAEQMLAGLSAAHNQGVVHRDFKSSNVMLVASPDGSQSTRVVVTDFGLGWRCRSLRSELRHGVRYLPGRQVHPRQCGHQERARQSRTVARQRHPCGAAAGSGLSHPLRQLPRRRILPGRRTVGGGLVPF